jgi:spore germination protein YaaH
MTGRQRLTSCLALLVSAATSGSTLLVAHGQSSAGPPVEGLARAHVLFDDSTGPWQSGVALGARPHTLTHPRAGVRDGVAGSDRAPAGAAASAAGQPPDPEVLGFAQSGEVTSGSWQRDLNMPLLTTIAYFGVNLNGDGSLVSNDSGYQGWRSAQATSLINAAHNAGDRVVLTVKAFNNATIAAVTGSANNRATAVNAIVAQVADRGADGVNVDFEGTDSSSAANFTAFVGALRSGLRSAIPQQAYVTVDAYASAASGGTMYDVRGLAANADAIDVMAYDITSPGSSTAGPVAPLNGMTYADTNVVNSYLALIPPSQVILGVPYYGYKWSTTTNQPRSPTRGAASADTYSGALADFQCAQSLSLNWDGTFASPWASWYSPATNDPCGGNHGSWRELYYENAQSLGAKYDLVNGQHLRGIGIWALGYDSGHQELWNEIATKFTVTHAPTPQMTALPATEGSTSFPLQWSVPSGSETVSRYIVYVEDGSTGWQTWTQTASTSTTFFGAPGHSYAFFVESEVAGGYNSGAPGSAPMASTVVSSSAPRTEPFAGLYAVDGYGNLHPGSSPPLPPGTLFAGWNIARGLTLGQSGLGGLVLDGWGGLHPFGDSAAAASRAYWRGWDIARAAATMPGDTGGYVLDGWGGVHAFAVGAAAISPDPHGTGYWPGWDIARAIVVLPDGSGGLVLDGFGGLHPFDSNGAVAPPTLSAYWNGWDIARGVVVVPGSTRSSYAGYVLDGWGGLHPFASQGRALPAVPAVSAFWRGYDIARGVTLVPGSTSGYVVDGFGGFWPFGGAPIVQSPNYGLDGATVRSPSAD